MIAWFTSPMHNIEHLMHTNNAVRNISTDTHARKNQQHQNV